MEGCQNQLGEIAHHALGDRWPGHQEDVVAEQLHHHQENHLVVDLKEHP